MGAYRHPSTRTGGDKPGGLARTVIVTVASGGERHSRQAEASAARRPDLGLIPPYLPSEDHRIEAAKLLELLLSTASVPDRPVVATESATRRGYLVTEPDQPAADEIAYTREE